jgi:hypothetical protein
MKKALAIMALGATVAFSANADMAGGSNAGAFTIGGVAGEVVIAGAVFTTWAVAAASNSTGSMLEDNEAVELYCADSTDDYLLNGDCVGTTSTVTVSGTGTVTVPVTYTYSPTYL